MSLSSKIKYHQCQQFKLCSTEIWRVVVIVRASWILLHKGKLFHNINTLETTNNNLYISCVNIIHERLSGARLCALFPILYILFKNTVFHFFKLQKSWFNKQQQKRCSILFKLGIVSWKWYHYCACFVVIVASVSMKRMVVLNFLSINITLIPKL